MTPPPAWKNTHKRKHSGELNNIQTDSTLRLKQYSVLINHTLIPPLGQLTPTQTATTTRHNLFKEGCQHLSAA